MLLLLKKKVLCAVKLKIRKDMLKVCIVLVTLGCRKVYIKYFENKYSTNLPYKIKQSYSIQY